jgi:hypothetical protein
MGETQDRSSISGHDPKDGQNEAYLCRDDVAWTHAAKSVAPRLRDMQISDVICILYPSTEAAQQELHRLARENSPHVYTKEEVDAVGVESTQANHGRYAIILSLEAKVKNPSVGLVFGRSSSEADVTLVSGNVDCVSHLHFCILHSHHGHVVIRDQSANGTFVNEELIGKYSYTDKGLIIEGKPLVSGDIISLMRNEVSPLAFRVYIPTPQEVANRKCWRDTTDPHIQFSQGSIKSFPSGRDDAALHPRGYFEPVSALTYSKHHISRGPSPGPGSFRALRKRPSQLAGGKHPAKQLESVYLQKAREYHKVNATLAVQQRLPD